jgi:hypothetical protein
MRPDVARNLVLGQEMIKEMVPTSARQIWLRQQSIRSLRYLPWKNLVRKQVVRPIREAANAITLKDYELARVPA